MASWTQLGAVGLPCKDRPIRVTESMTVECIGPGQGRVTLPRWAEGYCYGASAGGIYVGFTRAFIATRLGATRYDFNVVFNFRDLPKLQIG